MTKLIPAIPKPKVKTIFIGKGVINYALILPSYALGTISKTFSCK